MYQWDAIIDIWTPRLVENLAWVRVHEVASQVIGVHDYNVLIIQASSFQHLISLQ